MREYEILSKIQKSYQSILGNKLVGIYVHGSIAFKCFQWDKSDIDFIAVVNEKLDLKEKEAIISEILLLDEFCPPKGVEMSVVLENVCKPFVYPTPYELHFSNDHKEGYKADLTGYCQMLSGTDKDLAAHVTVIREVGIVLCGKSVSEVFAEVPRESYLDSIIEDIKDAEENITENPVYFILNLCRVSAYLEKNVVISKHQGGEWGIQNLPAVYVPMVKKALDCYNGESDFAEERLVLQRFGRYMLKRILG